MKPTLGLLREARARVYRAHRRKQRVELPRGASTSALTGLVLPPQELRTGGAHFLDDDAYMDSAVDEAQRLVSSAPSSRRPVRILDIGCGAGRLAYGLAALDEPPVNYLGLDVRPIVIQWAQENITRSRPELRFKLIDVQNDRYNPGGSRRRRVRRLPVWRGRVDVAHAYSVFSHMTSGDVRAYLREVRRVLARGGVGFVTAFVEPDVPDETVNPEGYGPLAWDGPLHCVRFSSEYFREMVRDAGLELEIVGQGTETDGQSLLRLTRR